MNLEHVEAARLEYVRSLCAAQQELQSHNERLAKSLKEQVVKTEEALKARDYWVSRSTRLKEEVDLRVDEADTLRRRLAEQSPALNEQPAKCKDDCNVEALMAENAALRLRLNVLSGMAQVMRTVVADANR